MREYTKKPENQSRTLDSNPRASRQAPIDVILHKKNIQRYAEDEELLQDKFETAQRKEPDEEEILQGKSDPALASEQESVQREERPNNTGLPDNLKTDIENLSGYSIDDVRVHYNSDKPAQLQALAYAQGTDIHVASGQEKHLPHELGHVIQQMKGSVSPTVSLNNILVNDDLRLEKEADNFAGAIQRKKAEAISDKYIGKNAHVNVIQMLQIGGLIQGDSNVTSRVYAAVSKKNNLKNKVNKNYDYQVRSYKHAFVEASEDNVRAKIKEIGALASTDKFTSNDNRVNITINNDKTWKDVKRDDLEKGLHPSADFYAPFILRLENINKHKKNDGFEKLTKPLNFDILFASGFYGYVVKVGDSHMEADTTNSNSLKYKDAPADQTIYKFKHDENNDNHAGKIGDYATDWNDDNVARHQSADSITKVIGEGSRWQAVAELANRGNLKDSSVFYIHNDNQDAKPAQIKLSGLWKTWANPFENKFGITNAVLKIKLQDGAGKINDFKVSGDECKKISELEADDVNYKLL